MKPHDVHRPYFFVYSSSHSTSYILKTKEYSSKKWWKRILHPLVGYDSKHYGVYQTLFPVSLEGACAEKEWGTSADKVQYCGAALQESTYHWTEDSSCEQNQDPVKIQLQFILKPLDDFLPWARGLLHPVALAPSNTLCCFLNKWFSLSLSLVWYVYLCSHPWVQNFPKERIYRACVHLWTY